MQFGGFAGNFGKTTLAGNRPAIEALKGADIVIDLMFLLFSEEQLEITNSGTRMLLVMEPLEVLTRMFPNADLRRRVEVGEHLLKTSKVMHITSPHGTDVTYRLGQYPVMTEYGYTDTPGRWDHWPAGFLFTSGADDGVDGTVVLQRGDIVALPFKKYVEDPVEFVIEQGRIQDVRGGFDADLLRDYIAGYDDEKAYGIAHIGWGCNEKARWSGRWSMRGRWKGSCTRSRRRRARGARCWWAAGGRRCPGSRGTSCSRRSSERRRATICRSRRKRPLRRSCTCSRTRSWIRRSRCRTASIRG